MPTYHGTDADDLIEQSALGPAYAVDTYVYGGAGNDHIRWSSGSVEGEAGNDSIEALGPGVSSLYWGSPTGIHADLASGLVQDGYGTVDTLSGIAVIGGSPHDDVISGGPADDRLIGNGGNDSFTGGGGYDTVTYFNADPAEAQVGYDEATGTCTVVRQFASGDHGVDTLSGIDVIAFIRPDGSQVNVTPPQGGPMPEVAWTSLQRAEGAFFSYLVPGDFDGDGLGDLVITQSIGTGTGAAPLLGFVQDGDGALAAADLFAGPALPYAGALTPFVADLDRNGKADLIALNFGDDKPPYAGGFNSIFIAGADGLALLPAAAVGAVQATHHGGSAGDLDGDGDIDLLLNALDEQSTYALLNQGAGGWQLDDDMFAGLDSSPCSLVADFDLDGRNDVFLARWAGNPGGGQARVLWGSQAGFSVQDSSVLPASGVSGESMLSARLIDLNGDDLPDLAINLTSGGDANAYRTPFIQLLVNLGNGQFADETAVRLPQPKAGSTNNYGGICVADFNQDGRDDLLAAGGGAVDSVLWLAQAGGTFEEAWRSPNDYAQAIDVGGDGVWDVVSLGTGNTLAVHENHLTLGGVLRVAVGGVELSGGPAGETLWGRSGDERLRAGGGDDTLCGAAGDDSLEGGEGVDTAGFSVPLASLGLQRAGASWLVTAPDGNDSLAGIERLHAADGWLALDIDAGETPGAGAAGITACIIGAVFGAAHVGNPVYVGIGLSLLDGGMDAQALTGLALDVALGAGASAADVVERLWTNVMGAAPTPAEAAPFIAVLEAGMPRSTLGWLAASTAINQDNVDLVGLAQTGLAFAPAA